MRGYAERRVAKRNRSIEQLSQGVGTVRAKVAAVTAVERNFPGLRFWLLKPPLWEGQVAGVTGIVDLVHLAPCKGNEQGAERRTAVGAVGRAIGGSRVGAYDAARRLELVQHRTRP